MSPDKRGPWYVVVILVLLLFEVVVGEVSRSVSQTSRSRTGATVKHFLYGQSQSGPSSLTVPRTADTPDLGTVSSTR